MAGRRFPDKPSEFVPAPPGSTEFAELQNLASNSATFASAGSGSAEFAPELRVTLSVAGLKPAKRNSQPEFPPGE